MILPHTPMKVTKSDMARAIVTALHNLPSLVRPTDHRVVQMVNRGTVATLSFKYEIALRVLKEAKRAANAACHI